ncbi:GNAT family N-acetyltransferase [Rhodopirellula bahusiensis]|uniref:GNAT family N-acetyltransferase n=1 Tax=Rhodopirellula bahusiensis TaxID=2014065 RepID=A0A2G1VYF1_9BACT|nr:GNAT family N-acetyltransferase [Rhodopirellula bahusiensis]PHQ31818.1 GNAT family N-acetyltransferase [Rhodopirellula bahusiensis]
MIHIEISDSPENLLADGNTWDRLAGGIPFRQTVWLRSWWQQFGDAERAFFLVARDESGACCGLLPLERTDGDLRRLQTIAAGNVCTDHVSILTRPEDREEVATAFAKHLIECSSDRTHGWDQIDFDGTIAGDPAMEIFARCLEDQEVPTSIRSRMHLWFNRCEATWEDLLATRSRKYRNRVRGLLRKLDESDGELFVRDAAAPEEVHMGLLKLIELHQKRWQDAGEPGTYADDRMIRFVTDATLEMSDRGRLVLPQLIYRDEVIATELHFIGDDRRQYCYSTGVNHAYPDLKPGIMLNSHMFREAHRLGRAGIDYMRGDETYKGRLHSRPIPLLEISVFAKHARGQVRMAQDRATQLLKVQWRRVKDLPQDQPLTIEEAFAEEHRSFLPDQTPLPSPTLHHEVSAMLPIRTVESEILFDADEETSEPPMIYSMSDYRRSDAHSHEPEPSN